MKKIAVGEGIPLSKLAEHIKLSPVGDSDRLIKGLAPLEDPIEGCIAFYSGKNLQKLAGLLEGSPLAAVIVEKKSNLEKLPKNISYLLSPEPMRSFVDAVSLFYQPYPTSLNISSLASVHPSCKIGKSVTISDFVSIAADCTIGDNVIIHPHVTIYPEVTIGAGSVIHAGATIRERCDLGAGTILQNGVVVGSDGFGYMPDAEIGIRAVPQVGTVKIGAKVEIGANSCIDRGAFGETIIGASTKLDNMVQVGHNAKVGSYSLLCAHVALAGSAVIGNQVTIGGNSAVANRVVLGDGVRLAGQSAATNSLSEKGDYGGFPAQPISRWRRQVTALRRLPDLLKKLKSEGDDSEEE